MNLANLPHIFAAFLNLTPWFGTSNKCVEFVQLTETQNRSLIEGLTLESYKNLNKELEHDLVYEILFLHPLKNDPLVSLLKQMGIKNYTTPAPLIEEVVRFFTKRVDEWVQTGKLSKRDRIDLGYAILPESFKGASKAEQSKHMKYIPCFGTLPEGYFIYEGFIETHNFVEAIGKYGLLIISPTSTGANILESFIDKISSGLVNFKYNQLSIIQHDLTHAAILLESHLSQTPEWMKTVRRNFRRSYYSNPSRDTASIQRMLIGLENFELLDKDADEKLVALKLVDPKFIQQRTTLDAIRFKNMQKENGELLENLKSWIKILETDRVPFGAVSGSFAHVNQFLSSRSKTISSFWLTIYKHMKLFIEKKDSSVNDNHLKELLAFAEMSYYIDRHFGSTHQWLDLILNPNHRRRWELKEWAKDSGWLYTIYWNAPDWGRLVLESSWDG